MNAIVSQVARYRDEQLAGSGRGATVIAALFSLAMITVPWERLAGHAFEDKRVFLERFMYLESIVKEKGISDNFDFFINEALWDVLVRHATALFHVSVATVFMAISFLCLFSFARFLVKRHGVAALLLLINPLVIDFAFSQLRLALAISVAMPIFEALHKRRAVIPVVIACYIHTATTLFVGMYLAGRFAVRRLAQRRASPTLTCAILIAIGLTVAIAVGPLRELILGYVGDRRAEYEMRPASFLYTSFWIVFLFAMPFQGFAFYQEDTHVLAVSSLATFAATTFFGIEGIRFVAAAYPFIVSSLLSLGGSTRPTIMLGFAGYMTAQWYFWLA